MDRTKGETVKAVAFMQLDKQIGPTKAAKAIGISGTTLYKARTAGRVSRAYEVAANGILSNPTALEAARRGDMEMLNAALSGPAQASPSPQLHAASADGKTVLIISVPNNKADLLRTVAKQFGAEVE